ncbi:MAG: DEAD/DEAH box helicase [Verrucomicrobiota bacterium]
MKDYPQQPRKRSATNRKKKKPYRPGSSRSESQERRERTPKLEKRISKLKDIPEPNGSFKHLCKALHHSIAAQGYDTPTAIQEQCIPHLLEGKDLLGSAQTGTGKTAAFTLPLLHKLSENKNKLVRNTPQALILAPTRELAAQIGKSIETYGSYMRFSHTVIYGGVKQFGQVRALNRGVDVLVATPGRLLDLFEQGHINLNKICYFILDEVDRMLDMGFVPDIKRVLVELPDSSERQTVFFSATMPPKVRELAQTMLQEDATHITIAPDKPAVERISQKIFFVGKKNKDALLLSLLKDQTINKAIIFTQMKHAANQVVEKLSSSGIRGTAIHGNKTQAARTRALDDFKRGRFKVMVATDVAARGLDVDDITHVINYDLPMEAETYVHRIGRTGRAGADGDAISFCCAEDRIFLREIEKLLGKPVPYDMDHPFHCDRAYKSRLPAPKKGGRARFTGSGRGRTRGRRKDKNFKKSGSYKSEKWS